MITLIETLIKMLVHYRYFKIKVLIFRWIWRKNYGIIIVATNLFCLPQARSYEVDGIILLGNKGVKGDIFY